MSSTAFKAITVVGLALLASLTLVPPAHAGCMPLGSAGGLIKNNGLVPGKVAVNKAQSKGGGKVIKIVLCQNGNNFVYRATVLSKKGAVKNVTVNAKTGQ
ncbi:MAG: hypothetical protein AAF405_03225 [Pseudomonadota bacterium]